MKMWTGRAGPGRAAATVAHTATGRAGPAGPAVLRKKQTGRAVQSTGRANTFRPVQCSTSYGLYDTYAIF